MACQFRSTFAVPREIDPQTTTYLYLRTLPADGAMAGLDPTWTNVFVSKAQRSSHSVLTPWRATSLGSIGSIANQGMPGGSGLGHLCA